MEEPMFADDWKLIIDKLDGSKFHTGQNESGWKATVDWIIKNDTNYAKILESAKETSSEKAKLADQKLRAEQQGKLRKFKEDNENFINSAESGRLVNMWKTMRDPRYRKLINELRPEIKELVESGKV